MSAISGDGLHGIARRAGIQTRWRDNDGCEHDVGEETLLALLDALFPQDMQGAGARDWMDALPCEAQFTPPLTSAWCSEEVTLPQAFLAHQNVHVRLDARRSEKRAVRINAQGAPVIAAISQAGYFEIEAGDLRIAAAIAPRRCYSIEDVAGAGNIWGASAQIHALRHDEGARAHAFGSGDFAAVRQHAVRLAREGADALAISPAHALFAADGYHYSPYSPSNRCFLNILHANALDMFDSERVAAAAQRAFLQHEDFLEQRDLIGWPQTARARMELLRALFDDFEQHDLRHASATAKAFHGFCASRSAFLEAHATFEALHAAHFRRSPALWNWRTWPAAFSSPHREEVKMFAQANRREVTFHKFAQWLADASLAHAQREAKTAGMRIGLISDLAIGVSDGGSHAWSAPGDFLDGLSIGAPPDALAPKGQNWGLAAFSPLALRRNGFAPFIATLRAAMRHAGGVRIDHVFGMERLWLVPRGLASAQGAYLRNPCEDLLRLISLESWRHRCIVIGEDLGTAPDGLRERLAAHALAGMRVLLFERDGFKWRDGSSYPKPSVAMTTTHDTATLAGYWSGLDLERRAQCEQLPPGQLLADAQIERQREREGLSRAVTGESGPRALSEDAGRKEELARMVLACTEFVAAAEAQMAIIPLEDLIAQEEQPNLPGTIDEHPNWRRRYPANADALLCQSDVQARIGVVRERRASKKSRQRQA